MRSSRVIWLLIAVWGLVLTNPRFSSDFVVKYDLDMFVMRLSWASLNLFMKRMRKNWWWICLVQSSQYPKDVLKSIRIPLRLEVFEDKHSCSFPVLLKCFIISVSLFLHALESTLRLAESQGFSNPSVIVARLKFLRCQEYVFVFNKPIVVWNQQPMRKPTVSLTVFHSIFVLFV